MIHVDYHLVCERASYLTIKREFQNQWLWPLLPEAPKWEKGVCINLREKEMNKETLNPLSVGRGQSTLRFWCVIRGFPDLKVRSLPIFGLSVLPSHMWNISGSVWLLWTWNQVAHKIQRFGKGARPRASPSNLLLTKTCRPKRLFCQRFRYCPSC